MSRNDKCRKMTQKGEAEALQHSEGCTYQIITWKQVETARGKKRIASLCKTTSLQGDKEERISQHRDLLKDQAGAVFPPAGCC